MEVRKFMDAFSNYIIVDPDTFYGFEYMKNREITDAERETLLKEAEKLYKSLFRKNPPQPPFWCYGDNVACAGPIPNS